MKLQAFVILLAVGFSLVAKLSGAIPDQQCIETQDPNVL